MNHLLSASDLKGILGLKTPEAATKLMDEWGIPYIHLGPGRGRGRRWDADDVTRAIEARKRRPEATPTIRRRVRKDTEAERFFSMTAREARAWLERNSGKNNLSHLDVPCRGGVGASTPLFDPVLTS